MKVSRSTKLFVGFVVMVVASPSPATAQGGGPPLLGDTVDVGAAAPGAADPDAAVRARTHPFEVWSVGRVAQRNGRAAVVRSEVPARAPEVPAAQGGAGTGQAGAAGTGASPAPAVAGASPSSTTAAAGVGSGTGASAAPGSASSGAPAVSGAASAPPRPGAAPAPAASTPAAAAAGSRTHRVEWGETWLGIARQYGVSDSNLRAANPGIDPERIRSGQVLRIPAGSAVAQRSHTVAAGETLSSIARRYGVGADVIRSANRLTGDLLRVGQTLVIPGGQR